MVADEKRLKIFMKIYEEQTKKKPEETLEERDEDDYSLDANKKFAESQRYHELEEKFEEYSEGNHEEPEREPEDYGNEVFEELNDDSQEDEMEI